MQTSYEKILPPDTVAELINLGQSTSDVCFRIGDITNECILLNQLAGNEVTKQTVYKAVGAFTGKKSRTIRYYAEVAERFPADVRIAYEPLSFSHFSFVSKFANWQEILEYAMEHMDKGRPASVDQLIAVFGVAEQEPTERDIVIGLVESLRKKVYGIPMTGDMRRYVNDALDRVVEMVST